MAALKNITVGGILGVLFAKNKEFQDTVYDLEDVGVGIFSSLVKFARNITAHVADFFGQEDLARTLRGVDAFGREDAKQDHLSRRHESQDNTQVTTLQQTRINERTLKKYADMGITGLEIGKNPSEEQAENIVAKLGALRLQRDRNLRGTASETQTTIGETLSTIASDKALIAQMANNEIVTSVGLLRTENLSNPIGAVNVEIVFADSGNNIFEKFKNGAEGITKEQLDMPYFTNANNLTSVNLRNIGEKDGKRLIAYAKNLTHPDGTRYSDSDVRTYVLMADQSFEAVKHMYGTSATGEGESKIAGTKGITDYIDSIVATRPAGQNISGPNVGTPGLGSDITHRALPISLSQTSENNALNVIQQLSITHGAGTIKDHRFNRFNTISYTNGNQYKTRVITHQDSLYFIQAGIPAEAIGELDKLLANNDPSVEEYKNNPSRIIYDMHFANKPNTIPSSWNKLSELVSHNNPSGTGDNISQYNWYGSSKWIKGADGVGRELEVLDVFEAKKIAKDYNLTAQQIEKLDEALRDPTFLGSIKTGQEYGTRALSGGDTPTFGARNYTIRELADDESITSILGYIKARPDLLANKQANQEKSAVQSAFQAQLSGLNAENRAIAVASILATAKAEGIDILDPSGANILKDSIEALKGQPNGQAKHDKIFGILNATLTAHVKEQTGGKDINEIIVEILEALTSISGLNAPAKEAKKAAAAVVDANAFVSSGSPSNDNGSPTATPSEPSKGTGRGGK